MAFVEMGVRLWTGFTWLTIGSSSSLVYGISGSLGIAV
jgi:hypothetical protein